MCFPLIIIGVVAIAGGAYANYKGGGWVAETVENLDQAFNNSYRLDLNAAATNNNAIGAWLGFSEQDIRNNASHRQGEFATGDTEMGQTLQRVGDGAMILGSLPVIGGGAMGFNAARGTWAAANGFRASFAAGTSLLGYGSVVATGVTGVGYGVAGAVADADDSTNNDLAGSAAYSAIFRSLANHSAIARKLEGGEMPLDANGQPRYVNPQTGGFDPGLAVKQVLTDYRQLIAARIPGFSLSLDGAFAVAVSVNEWPSDRSLVEDRLKALAETYGIAVPNMDSVTPKQFLQQVIAAAGARVDPPVTFGASELEFYTEIYSMSSMETAIGYVRDELARQKTINAGASQSHASLDAQLNALTTSLYSQDTYQALVKAPSQLPSSLDSLRGRTEDATRDMAASWDEYSGIIQNSQELSRTNEEISQGFKDIFQNIMKSILDFVQGLFGQHTTSMDSDEERDAAAEDMANDPALDSFETLEPGKTMDQLAQEGVTVPDGIPGNISLQNLSGAQLTAVLAANPSNTNLAGTVAPLFGKQVIEAYRDGDSAAIDAMKIQYAQIMDNPTLRAIFQQQMLSTSDGVRAFFLVGDAEGRADMLVNYLSQANWSAFVTASLDVMAPADREALIFGLIEDGAGRSAAQILNVMRGSSLYGDQHSQLIASIGSRGFNAEQMAELLAGIHPEDAAAIYRTLPDGLKQQLRDSASASPGENNAAWNGLVNVLVADNSLEPELYDRADVQALVAGRTIDQQMAAVTTLNIDYTRSNSASVERSAAAMM